MILEEVGIGFEDFALLGRFDIGLDGQHPRAAHLVEQLYIIFSVER
jgi:hypothetical protein